MFQTIVKEIRPDITVDFFQGFFNPSVDQSMIDYYFQTYVETGKIIGTDKEISEDGLILTKTTIWDHQESYFQFRLDPILTEFFEIRKAYFRENKVKQIPISMTEI